MLQPQLQSSQLSTAVVRRLKQALKLVFCKQVIRWGNFQLVKQQGSNWEQLLVQFFLLLDLSDWGNSRNLIHLLLCSCLLTSRQLCSLETCFHWKTSNNNNNNNNNNAYIAPISILLQSNLAISNSVNSKSPLFRRKIECPWIYSSPLRFPGYFEAPLFRTFFHFPRDFEIAGFDCIFISA